MVQGIKNILIGATPKDKMVHGATYATCAGAAAGFLATKGVIALTAGSALAIAGSWALLAVAVGGIALAILGAIQKCRGRQDGAEGLAANHKLNLQWTEDAKMKERTESVARKQLINEMENDPFFQKHFSAVQAS